MGRGRPAPVAIPAQAFELVLLFYVQVPAREHQQIVRAAAKAVTPGGTLLLVAHDSRNLERGYGGPKDAAVLYRPKEIVADLDGFEIERAELVERPVETPASERVALDALVRAHRPNQPPTTSKTRPHPPKARVPRNTNEPGTT